MSETVTPAELAHRVRARTGLRLEPAFTRSMLADWQARGIAVEEFGRWRLTETGHALFGAFVGVELEAAA